MGREIKSKVLRIDCRLEQQIRDIAIKNRMRFTDASRDMADFFDKFKNKNMRRDLGF